MIFSKVLFKTTNDNFAATTTLLPLISTKVPSKVASLLSKVVYLRNKRERQTSNSYNTTKPRVVSKAMQVMKIDTEHPRMWHHVMARWYRRMHRTHDGELSARFIHGFKKSTVRAQNFEFPRTPWLRKPGLNFPLLFRKSQCSPGKNGMPSGFAEDMTCMHICRLYI